jgi:hypothetical protein
VQLVVTRTNFTGFIEQEAAIEDTVVFENQLRSDQDHNAVLAGFGAERGEADIVGLAIG